MSEFNWDKIQYTEDGKVLLLYRHERIFTEGLIKPGDAVLDVGGWGHLTERIIQEKATCTVLDIFSNDQYFPDRVKQLSYISGDVTDSIFMSDLMGRYNVVSCFETLEHVSDQNLAVYNIANCLTLGGNFVGTVPIPGHCHYLGEPGIAFLNESQLRYLLSSNGFGSIFIEPTGSLTSDEAPSSLYFRGVKQ